MSTTLPPLPVLTDEQERGLDYLSSNLNRGLLALAGPAGSGKTTMMRALVERLQQEEQLVVVTATTNKASYVLRQKGIPAVTFHQACMRPVFRPPLDKLQSLLNQAQYYKNNNNIIKSFKLVEEFGDAALDAALDTMRTAGIYSALRLLGIKDVFKYIERWTPAPPQQGVLVVDEASMLGTDELKTAREVYSSIILVGDEWQLPPVKGDPEFWNVKNRFCLTEIHRQAADAQPLKIATALRTGASWQMESIDPIALDACRKGVPIIVWKHKTREALTKEIRAALGYAGGPPQPGEVLVCRNSGDRQAKNRGLINNSLWTVLQSDGFRVTIEGDNGEILEDESIHIEELDKGYGVPFRFAYSLTCHSAQGSEWPEVMIHTDDAFGFQDFKPAESRRWLYTACTRAKERVIWVSDEVK